MWVFGYGSLMWDGWEHRFGCTRTVPAILPAFQRDFNKASVRNWGTRQNPGPTLGLTPAAKGECRGLAFEFSDAERERILAALRARESPSFELQNRDVDLVSSGRVTAVVPLNNRSSGTFIGGQPLEERVRLALRARGECGTCIDYVKAIRTKLVELQIQDPAVERFWKLVSEE